MANSLVATWDVFLWLSILLLSTHYSLGQTGKQYLYTYLYLYHMLNVLWG